MNIYHYKSMIYQMLEYLKKAQYMDWFKAYLSMNIILGLIPVILFLIILISKTPTITFITAVQLCTASIAQVTIKAILASLIIALFATFCFRHAPRLCLILIIIKDLIFTIALTITTITSTQALNTAPLLGILLVFIVSLIVMFGFTYCTIRLVIRNVKKHEKHQNPSFNQ